MQQYAVHCATGCKAFLSLPQLPVCITCRPLSVYMSLQLLIIHDKRVFEVSSTPVGSSTPSGTVRVLCHLLASLKRNFSSALLPGSLARPLKVLDCLAWLLIVVVTVPRDSGTKVAPQRDRTPSNGNLDSPLTIALLSTGIHEC